MDDIFTHGSFLADTSNRQRSDPARFFRHVILLEIAEKIGTQYGVQALEKLEPNIPWTEQVLNYRVDCYRETGNPLLKRAEKELHRFLKNKPKPFATD